MYILNEYDDGSKSWAYETGDQVVLTSGKVIRSLHGYTIKTYKAGDVVEITGRSAQDRTLLPEMLSFYRFNNHILETIFASGAKPVDESLVKPPALAFVVPWHEGRMHKWSLVAARTAKEARERTFAAKHFTDERMKGITIGEIFEKGDWTLPEGERWISWIPLF